MPGPKGVPRLLSVSSLASTLATTTSLSLPTSLPPVHLHVLNRREHEPMLLRKHLEFWCPHHLTAVVRHNLTQHPRRRQPGHASQVHRCLRVSVPRQHATIHSTQRKDVSRPCQIARRCPAFRSRVRFEYGLTGQPALGGAGGRCSNGTREQKLQKPQPIRPAWRRQRLGSGRSLLGRTMRRQHAAPSNSSPGVRKCAQSHCAVRCRDASRDALADVQIHRDRERCALGIFVLRHHLR